MIFKKIWNVVKFDLKRFLVVHFKCTVFLNNLHTCLKNDENPISEYIFCKVLYGSIETELYLCQFSP